MSQQDFDIAEDVKNGDLVCISKGAHKLVKLKKTITAIKTDILIPNVEGIKCTNSHVLVAGIVSGKARLQCYNPSRDKEVWKVNLNISPPVSKKIVIATSNSEVYVSVDHGILVHSLTTGKHLDTLNTYGISCLAGMGNGIVVGGYDKVSKTGFIRRYVADEKNIHTISWKLDFKEEVISLSFAGEGMLNCLTPTTFSRVNYVSGKVESVVGLTATDYLTDEKQAVINGRDIKLDSEVSEMKEPFTVESFCMLKEAVVADKITYLTMFAKGRITLLGQVVMVRSLSLVVATLDETDGVNFCVFSGNFEGHDKIDATVMNNSVYVTGTVDGRISTKKFSASTGNLARYIIRIDNGLVEELSVVPIKEKISLPMIESTREFLFTVGDGLVQCYKLAFPKLVGIYNKNMFIYTGRAEIKGLVDGEEYFISSEGKLVPGGGEIYFATAVNSKLLYIK